MFSLLFLLCVSPIAVVAETASDSDLSDLFPESEEVAPYWQAFLEYIPDEVASLLPPEFFTTDPTGAADAVTTASGGRAVLAVIGRMTGLALRENLFLLAQICGVLLISAVFRGMGKGLEGGLGKALSFCGTLTLVVLLFSLQRDRFSQISAFFQILQKLSLAVLPLMGVLYAMGGNIGAAIANHGVMSLFLTVLETVIAGSVLPVAGICLALALPDAVSGKFNLRAIGALIKRTYTLVFSFLMMVLCGVLGIQTTLAKGADTLALRTIRFAAGSFLPVVGGSVSEALRTVSGSVQYLRSVVGTGAILVFSFLFLPTFVSVMLNRIVFMLGGSVAKLFGSDGEERILSEMASIYGYFLAVTASLFVLVIFSLTLFARCATAGGGG